MIKKSFFLLLLLTPLFVGFVGIGDNQIINQSILQNNENYYLSNMLVIKFKNDFYGNTNLIENFLNNISSFKLLKNVTVEQVFRNNNKLSSFNLDKIYFLKYEGNKDPLILANEVKSNSNFEYVEPKYIYKTDHIPNDPAFYQQYYLRKVELPQGWETSKGDSTVIIGIIDTGVYWNHPDINANIWHNYQEIPNNSIDDDNNGFVDDVIGWDFGGTNGNPDNNPAEDRPDHGTHVAGIASASTNNGVGISGVGYNCRIMAVKTSRDDQRDPGSGAPYIVYGYEGIKYAADNGAKVINCSWGGYGFSNLGQDVINYANSKGSLVVAAAGNGARSDDHFPSSYKNVLSVAATDSTDTKAGFSNYNYGIDVSAPGVYIYATWAANDYLYLNGTSMSSPLVAGLAGLTFSHFPSFTPEQVLEKIRVSSDDITSINPSYQYRIGKGRVNAYRTLGNSDNKSIRILSYKLDDAPPLGNGNGILEPNESANILCDFKNILNSTINSRITLTSLSSEVVVNVSEFAAGARTSGEIFNNNSSPLKITALSSLKQDQTVILLFNFTDQGYTDYQVITFRAYPTYVTAFNDLIEATICSKGNIGFNDYPQNVQGLGFKFDGSKNLLFEGSLILGTSQTKISDRARGSNANLQNQDFTQVVPIKLFIPGKRADIQTTSEFNDDGAGSNKIGIKTVLNTYSFSDDNLAKFILLHYKFINTSGSTISNFHSGLFLDWDLIEGSGLEDVVRWDDVNKIGYAYNSTRTVKPYMGCGVINTNLFHYRAILNAGGDGGWGIYDGFTDTEKWESISGGLSKVNAGAGDVSHVIATGPYNINNGDTLNLMFAIVGGDTLSTMQAAYNNAKSKGLEILTNIDDNKIIDYTYLLSQNYPNPFNSSTKIKFSVPNKEFVSITIYDLLGKQITKALEKELQGGEYELNFDSKELSSGIYIYSIKTKNFTQSKIMHLLK